MAAFFRDLRFAFRVLLKSPIATSVAVLALALGIGVNASSFALINAMILHPFPYPNISRIVRVWETIPKLPAERNLVAPANFLDLTKQSRSFQRLAAFRNWNVNVIGAGTPERVQAYSVTPNFFAVLGMKAARGRTFGADESDSPHSRSIVISEAFWKSHFASSPGVLGTAIFLGAEKYNVVGVMPDEFDYPLQTQIWSVLTIGPGDQHQRASRDLMVIGLLKPGLSFADARAEASAVGSSLAQQYPDTNEDRSLVIVPLSQMTQTITNHFIATLLGAAGFVLLLACANIGNLQLARAANRYREIAIRAALGANRLQLARQLLAESVVISIAAGALGLVLGSWNSDYTRSHLPEVALRVVPGLRTLRIDSTVVFFTLAVSLFTGILCSLPAIAQLVHRRMRADLSETLRDRAGGQGSNLTGNRLRSALIVSEIALAMVLLVGAGLMVKTFERLLTRNQGFDPKNLLTMQISLPSADYKDQAHLVSFYDRVLPGLETCAGVTRAGLSSSLGMADHLFIEGQPEPRPGEPRPSTSAVSAGYLATMRIPILQGRSISIADRPQSQRVVVISETVARHYWPHSNPIGHHIKLKSHSEWLTVVGVAADVIDDWFTGKPSPAAYIPYTQFPGSTSQLVLRTTDDQLQATSGARLAIRNVDATLPVYDVKTMEQSVAEERSGVRSAAATMTVYASIALLLAVTGIYAVVSYFVTARTHDFGVYIALGASSSDVVRMTMTQSVRLTLLGLALGIPLAVALGRIMSSVLFNVVNVDSITVITFAAVLAGCALTASYLPSRRATRIDPMTALRND